MPLTGQLTTAERLRRIGEARDETEAKRTETKTQQRNRERVDPSGNMLRLRFAIDWKTLTTGSGDVREAMKWMDGMVVSPDGVVLFKSVDATADGKTMTPLEGIIPTPLNRPIMDTVLCPDHEYEDRRDALYRAVHHPDRTSTVVRIDAVTFWRMFMVSVEIMTIAHELWAKWAPPDLYSFQCEVAFTWL